jgi:hypothetical protein
MAMTIMSQRECLRKIVIISFASRNVPQLPRPPNAFWRFAAGHPAQVEGSSNEIFEIGSRNLSVLAGRRLIFGGAWRSIAQFPESIPMHRADAFPW